VAGRKSAGAGDQGIDPELTGAIAERLLGRAPRVASATELGRRTVGRFRQGLTETGDLEREITFSRDLRPDQAPRVVAHELGHAIDELAGQINTKGLTQELEQVYSDLYGGPAYQGKTRHKSRPQDLGYRTSEVPRELIAEAIRAYMTDPNYLKTVAPKTAEAFRRSVNENPA
jgi:hypothetical protein